MKPLFIIILIGGVFCITGFFSLKLLYDAESSYQEMISDDFSPFKFQFLKGFILSFTRDKKKIFSWQYPPEFVNDEHLGWKQKPSSTIHYVLRTEDTVIWDVFYNFDQHSRRITPVVWPSKRDQFAIFFGCSFTHGQGLNDNQTLPYFFALNNGKYMPYNYAIRASGPHMMLAFLENTEFKNQIPENNGVFIYVFIESHIQRANGFMQERSYGAQTPVYKEKGGVLVNSGNFQQNQPLTTFIYSFLDKQLGFAKIFKRNFPRVTEKHIKYTCDLIVRSKDVFLTQYPDSKFLFFTFHKNHLPEDLKKCLVQNEVPVLVGPDMPLEEVELSYFPYDGHPTEYHHKKYGKVLSDMIIGK